MKDVQYYFIDGRQYEVVISFDSNKTEDRLSWDIDVKTRKNPESKNWSDIFAQKTIAKQTNPIRKRNLKIAALRRRVGAETADKWIEYGISHITSMFATTVQELSGNCQEDIHEVIYKNIQSPKIKLADRPKRKYTRRNKKSDVTEISSDSTSVTEQDIRQKRKYTKRKKTVSDNKNVLVVPEIRKKRKYTKRTAVVTDVETVEKKAKRQYKPRIRKHGIGIEPLEIVRVQEPDRNELNIENVSVGNLSNGEQSIVKNNR